MTSFLIRFQEFLRETSEKSYVTVTGTQTQTHTHTFVQNEQVDVDQQQHQFRLVPLDTKALGNRIRSQRSIDSMIGKTKTVTEVRQEGADNDPG